MRRLRDGRVSRTRGAAFGYRRTGEILDRSRRDRRDGRPSSASAVTATSKRASTTTRSRSIATRSASCRSRVWAWKAATSILTAIGEAGALREMQLTPKRKRSSRRGHRKRGRRLVFVHLRLGQAERALGEIPPRQGRALSRLRTRRRRGLRRRRSQLFAMIEPLVRDADPANSSASTPVIGPFRKLFRRIRPYQGDARRNAEPDVCNSASAKSGCHPNFPTAAARHRTT